MGQGKPSKVAEQTLYQGKKVKRRVEDENLNVPEQRFPATTASALSRSSASATISQTHRNLEQTEPEDKKLSVVTDAAKIPASTTSESLPLSGGGVASALGEGNRGLSSASWQEEPVHAVESPMSPTTSQTALLISTCRPGTGTAKLQREDKAAVTTTQEDSKERILILPPIQPRLMLPLTSATSEPLSLSTASAGTAKPQGEGKEIETTQEDPVEPGPEQPPIKPKAKDESSASSHSHARKTSRRKKHRQTRHKSRHGEWKPVCYLPCTLSVAS